MQEIASFRKIIYPGAFDPLTYGHEDLIVRATKLFDQVVVGVAAESSKQFTFSLDERVQIIREVVQDNPKVVVEPFNGLLVDFLKKKNIMCVLRGLRAVSDFEYEIQLASINRNLFSNMETVFMTPSEQFTYISSSLVKQIARLGGSTDKFVSPVVRKALQDKY